MIFSIVVLSVALIIPANRLRHAISQEKLLVKLGKFPGNMPWVGIAIDDSPECSDPVPLGFYGSMFHDVTSIELLRVDADKVFHGLPNISCVKRVKLSECSLSHCGIEDIARFDVEYLTIESLSAEVTRESLHTVAAMRRLKEVRLYCRGYTSSDIAMLKLSRPDVFVIIPPEVK
jgi:hypothetical protein